MPTYEYEATEDGCPFPDCNGHFEEFQAVADPPLTHCGVCGVACHRLISLPAVKRIDHPVAQGRELAKHGFARYDRIGNGVYERTGGTDEQGPRILKRDK